MTDTADRVRLYELVIENGRSSSPYVWRIRYALAHKGIPFDSVPLGFTEIPARFGGRLRTLPAIEHGGTTMNESWDIATYLDRTFADRPPLFATPAEFAMARFTDEWFANAIMRQLFAIYALDVHDAARPEDRSYFRRTREERLKGRTLEEYTTDRPAKLQAVRAALAPLRNQLARFPFLGGESPSYCDYVVLGGFHWVASVGTLPLLAADDEPLRDWIERGFALYGGIGLDPRMKPLFE